MRVLFYVVVAIVFSSCATAVRQSDAPLSEYDKNTKYGIEPRPDGFRDLNLLFQISIHPGK